MTAARRRRIVVVDDNRAVRCAVQRQLDTLGWEVYPAGTAREALSIVRSLGGVEALLTDVEMPVMDGVALWHEVASGFPEIVVLFMSGGTDPVDIPASAAPHGIILRKPFTLQALAEALSVSSAGAKNRGDE